jgi:hypothetical protein
VVLYFYIEGWFAQLITSALQEGLGHRLGSGAVQGQ